MIKFDDYFTVLSLFDGMSCGQMAINKVRNRKKYIYFASEIEQSSINVTKHNYPNTEHIGDVINITKKSVHYLEIDLLLGGSPCTDLSIAGKKKGLITDCLEEYLKLKKEGFKFHGQSYLFWEFVRILRELKPKYFFLENVLMSKEWENVITRELGVKPIRINSALVSAQNRDRLYWTNIPNVTVPQDKKISLSNIIVPGAKGCGYRGVLNPITNKYVPNFTIRKDDKSNCVVTSGNTNKIYVNGQDRDLTIKEMEMLQTIPVGYTDVNGVPKTKRKIMLGNGWTIDVISHFFEKIPELKRKRK
jgi:site-specific DNA-cytosine methylase